MVMLSRCAACAVFIALGVLLVGTTGSSGQDTVSLAVTVTPPQGVSSVRMFIKGSPQSVFPVPDNSGGKVSFQAEIPSLPVVNAIVSADFPHNATVSFPIIIGSAVPQRALDLELIGGTPTEAPDFTEVQRACSPQPVEPHQAFAMFFACRTMAISLSTSTRFRKAHKTAISGWLKANYFFVKDVDNAGTVSSFGADADLLAVLEEILQQDPQGRKDWSPLRFADIKSFVSLAKTVDIRLAANRSPDLLQEQQFPVALAVNNSALSSFDNLSATDKRETASRYGINKDLLQGNQELFAKLAPPPDFENLAVEVQ